MFDDCPIKEEYKPKHIFTDETNTVGSNKTNVITEAVSNGIKLALDDYEDDETVMSKNNIISI